MADIQLTQLGDIDISNDEFVLTQEDGSALRQRLIISLQFFKGEYFLDQRLGLPYFQEILIKSPRLGAVRSIFQSAILQVPGVESLNDLKLDFDNGERALAVTFTVNQNTATEVVFGEQDFIIEI